MKRSSSAQLELDYTATPAEQANIVAEPKDQQSDPASSAPLGLPNWRSYEEREMYALTSRMAGRINAASVSEEEHNALLRERQGLVDKELAGTISREEANRLTYVRWSLDRVEDAKYGQVLDLLESHVNRYEQFLYDIRSFQDKLWQLTKK